MPKKPDLIHAQLAESRRNQILDAATELFAKKGFHAATVREIAREAGIADGTVYIYFKTKPDLFLGILNRLNERERLAVDQAQHLNGEVSVRRFFADHLRQRMAAMDQNLRAFQAVLPDLLNNPELRERYLREVLEPGFRLAEPVFEHWIATGAIRSVNAMLAARAVPGMVLGMLVLRMMGDTNIAKLWMDLPELLTGLIFDGLRSEPGR